MKKKWLCFMMAVGLAMNLTSCKDVKNTEMTTEETAEAATTGEEKGEETTGEETTAEPTDAAVFSRGIWDGTTFTNNWLNMKITFPDDVTIMTEEEIKQVREDTVDRLKNSGNVGDYSDAKFQIEETLFDYDFFVLLPDGVSNVSLYYELLLIGDPANKDGEAYLTQAQEQLGEVADLQYEFGEIENVTLGVNTFAKLHSSAMGGAMYQDVYSMRKGVHMVSMVINYLPDSQEMVDEIVSSITTAE